MRHMNLILGAAVVAIGFAQTGYAQQQGIAWQPDIRTAQQVAGQARKLVLVHFWSPSCVPCAKVEQEVFSRPETIQALNANFVCVKVNTDDAVEIARTYNVTMLPTDVVLSADGRLIAQLRSPTDANQYIQKVSQVAEGYRQLTGQLATESGRAGDYARQLGGRVQESLAGPTLGGAGPAMAQAPPPVAGGIAPGQSAAPSGPVIPPQNSAASSTQGPAIPAYAEDRYADYLRQGQAEAGRDAAAVASEASKAAPSVSDYASRFAPPTATQQPVAQTGIPAIPNAYSPHATATNDPRKQPPTMQPPAAAIQLPPGSPPLGLDGYCTVMLKEQKRWIAGDRRWGAVHRGRTYLFTGPDEQKKFLESPDTYAPVMSGNDPVLALDNAQSVPGKREHGVFFENRVYLFSQEASLARFYQNPGRYAAEVIQAMR